MNHASDRYGATLTQGPMLTQLSSGPGTDIMKPVETSQQTNFCIRQRDLELTSVRTHVKQSAVLLW